MKRLTSLVLTGAVSLGILAGCGADKEELTLDPKHKELPDYVLNASDIIQETYIMACNLS